MLVLILVVFTIGLAGCASELSGKSYSRSEVRTVQKVEYSVIEQLRPVHIEGTKTPIGASTGAAVGGIAVSSIRGGKIGQVMAEAAIEEGATLTTGVEFTIMMNDDRTTANIRNTRDISGFRNADVTQLQTVVSHDRQA